MRSGFLSRSLLQLIVSGGQVLILAMFIVLFPRLAESPSEWAANYFLAMAITTPIFMFFGFELRKRTASTEASDISHFNRQRMFGNFAAIVLSLLSIPILIVTGLFADPVVFVAIVLFKTVQAINDQITANYEWRDAFRMSAMSGTLRLVLFVCAATIGSFAFGPNMGIVFGSLSFLAAWLLFDRRHQINVASWFTFKRGGTGSEDWLAGLGAFMISLTVNAPRLIAAYLFGEAALIIMGVGQSLNRIGQILSGSLVQTLLAVQKKTKDAKNETLVVGIQLGILVVLILALPVWRTVFDYASGAPEFTFALILLLIFGFASQINYLVQSLLLVRKGGAKFAASPVSFLIVLVIGMVVLWLAGALGFSSFLILLIVARLAQTALNGWQMGRE